MIGAAHVARRASRLAVESGSRLPQSKVLRTHANSPAFPDSHFAQKGGKRVKRREAGQVSFAYSGGAERSEETGR